MRPLFVFNSTSFHHLWSAVAVSLMLWQSARAADPTASGASNTAPAVVILPESVPDPLEPLNRLIWGFNRGLLTGVIKPTSKVYRHLVVKPVRTGIANFGRNITFPGRLLNHALQGKWRGAGDESRRFLWNTTVGVGGFWDVAEKQGIPRSDADFGQTFGKWGWRPSCFLMLPFVGPSSERDTAGLIADAAANPFLYFVPYKFKAANPLTYFGPYTYFSYAARYNGLADTVDDQVRFARATPDPYSELQYAWTFARASRVADFKVQGASDEASLETVQSVFFTFQDRRFPDRGATRSVLIPATGRRLKYTTWLQPAHAPLVYLAPGLGSHRLATTSLALAELAYRQGYSVVSVSSTFHPEFMERASTADVPGSLPRDGHDLHVALTIIDRQLEALHHGRLGERALLGYSMGALQSLYVAASDPSTQPSLLRFARIVALNSPARLLHGVFQLDEFYQAPLAWPATGRIGNIENTFLKVAALSQGTLTPQTSLPFDAIESRFLIGLTFRLALRDVIFSSQRRNPQGVLHHPVRSLRRDPVYQEILGYSYRDYFEKFVIPYYQKGGAAAETEAKLDQAGDLRTYQEALKNDLRVRVLTNQNDFLLTEDDVAWMRSTFGTDRLTVFPKGGHLGNLVNPEVQKTILEALKGLQ